MSLIVKGGSKEIEYSNVEFDSASNAFVCSTNNSEVQETFVIKLPFKMEVMPDSNFTEKIYCFKNHYHTGEKLIPLEFKESNNEAKRVGYIFSLENLVNNPEIFDNKYLKAIAFNTIKKLLKNEDVSIIAANATFRQDNNYELTDFYDDDLILVPICDNFVRFDNYDFKKYLFDFYIHGYFYCPHVNFYPQQNSSNYIKNKFNSIIVNLHFSAKESEVSNNPFLSAIINNVFHLQNNEVSRFHLYYQVIEMLMEKVFLKEIKKDICDEIPSSTGFDIKDKLREMMKDSFALSLLIGNNYSEIDSDVKEELVDNICSFLNFAKIKYENAEEKKKLNILLYKMRNTLFHGFSKVLENGSIDKSDLNLHFKRLNDSFECYIISLIYTFKITK